MLTREIPEEKAKCRGCGKVLVGTPYYKGGHAYDPKTMERCPVNFYGGYVCSKQCDVKICLEMSSSMPGAGEATSLCSLERQSGDRNWD